MHAITVLHHRMARPSLCPPSVGALIDACIHLDRTTRTTGVALESLLSSAIDAYCTQNGTNLTALVWPQFDEEGAPVKTKVAISHHRPTFSIPASAIISSASITLGAQIGQGAFGLVHRAVYHERTGSSNVAVKLLQPSGNNEDSVEERSSKFLEEALLLYQFQHEHIVQLLGIVNDGPTMMMVMELLQCDLLSLLRARRKTDPLTLSVQLDVCTQAASAVAFLTSQNVIHRDLAARCGLTGLGLFERLIAFAFLILIVLILFD
jgi:hypothetical protein